MHGWMGGTESGGIPHRHRDGMGRRLDASNEGSFGNGDIDGDADSIRLVCTGSFESTVWEGAVSGGDMRWQSMADAIGFGIVFELSNIGDFDVHLLVGWNVAQASAKYIYSRFRSQHACNTRASGVQRRLYILLAEIRSRTGPGLSSSGNSLPDASGSCSSKPAVSPRETALS